MHISLFWREWTPLQIDRLLYRTYVSVGPLFICFPKQRRRLDASRRIAP
jgi:hypothetical protein